MTTSLWADTRTFFPIFLEALKRRPDIESVLVVGAADGKFVLPLAEAGYRVTAIDVNASALFGKQGVPSGQVEEKYPGSENGLEHRIHARQLTSRVSIIHGDICDEKIPPHDALWTSCSWHYSLNHFRPLGSFIEALKQCVRPGGYFGAEYFMPVSMSHVDSEHYLEQGAIWNHLNDWKATWEAYTPPFIELPHVGQPESHIHRMGFVLASR
ncbi:class I SAM-dependent methyltransferase [Amycolatopsis sp. NPDC051716]|uniref:class I SAM-dependent methyltransferase n=1 Tax=Amycolatopsis sp. NPDC051716 TaxID=3155804 RepID=UPI0034393F5B